MSSSPFGSPLDSPIGVTRYQNQALVRGRSIVTSHTHIGHREVPYDSPIPTPGRR